jgi:GNAT superfamily N-acetyltransferase
MCSNRERAILIRRCRADEHARIGEMLVEAYAGLPGMPQPHEQPEYYEMLADVGKRNGNPSIRVFVAAGEHDVPVGTIDFITDMRHYGTSSLATTIPNAAGIRLLAVHPDWRGAGVGKALTRYCIEHARTLRKSSVILHTTRVMLTAWSMYARMGFERFPRIDFQQGALPVYGFKLQLEG